MAALGIALAGESWLATTAQDEALARIDFLVRKAHSIGLLTGPRGSGKSLVLRRVAQQQRRAGQAVALLDATMLTSAQAYDQLAAEWHNAAPYDASALRQWQAVREAMLTHACEQRASIALVDNAGDASFELLEMLARLVHAADMPPCSLALVLAVDTGRVSHLGAALLSRVDLRIELSPLDLEETRQFLWHCGWDATAGAPQLDVAAIERLYELSHGLPRRLKQLSDLVLVAAQGEGRALVDREMVDTVQRELALAHSSRR